VQAEHKGSSLAITLAGIATGALAVYVHWWFFLAIPAAIIVWSALRGAVSGLWTGLRWRRAQKNLTS
jgi:hypothetical protein